MTITHELIHALDEKRPILGNLPDVEQRMRDQGKAIYEQGSPIFQATIREVLQAKNPFQEIFVKAEILYKELNPDWAARKRTVQEESQMIASILQAMMHRVGRNYLSDPKAHGVFWNELTAYSISVDPELEKRVLDKLAGPSKSSASIKPVEKKPLKPLEYRKGNRTVIYLPGDKTPIETEYALVELKSLIVSHDKNYAANPDFPPELQPRDRDRSANKAQVEYIANILNPALLGESASATTGAPIVGPDGVVESGNGRIMALRKVQGRPQGEEYKAWLKEYGEKFGLSASEVGGMKSPVLVRVRLTDVNRPEFVKKANASETARLSPAEQAKADAEQILTPAVLGTLVVDEEGNIPASSNRDFSRAFLRNVPPSEMNEYLTAEGYATEKLHSRMTAALFDKAYGDKDLLSLVAEATQDNDIRNLTKALTSAAVPFIKAQGVDKSGEAKRMIDAVVSAVHVVRYARRNNIPLRNVLSQENAFEPIAEETSLLAQQIEHLKRSSAKLGEFFKHLAREMYNRETRQGNLSLFEDESPLSFVELIRKFITIPTVTYGQETTQSDTSLFGPADPSGGSGESKVSQ